MGFWGRYDQPVDLYTPIKRSLTKVVALTGLNFTLGRVPIPPLLVGILVAVEPLDIPQVSSNRSTKNWYEPYFPHSGCDIRYL